MSEAVHSSFDRQMLAPGLRSGEELLDPSEHTEDDLRDRCGYEIYPIRTEDGAEGNSVFLVMERPGDRVEPVRLVGDVTLRVSAVAGEGVVLVYTPGEGLQPRLLAADGGPNYGEAVELVQGESYGYINTGDRPFVVRDDCSMQFLPHYEVPADDPEFLAALESWN